MKTAFLISAALLFVQSQASDVDGSVALRGVDSHGRKLNLWTSLGFTCSRCRHGTRPWWRFGDCNCETGWKGACCDESAHVLVPIENDNVENELSYAKSGSNIPQAMHGIFWMDQRGKAVPKLTGKTDPEYSQVGSVAADEFLVSFGEATYDPTTRCVKVPVYGGEKGHWTFMNDVKEDRTKSNTHAATQSVLLTGDFCFTNDTFSEIVLDLRIKFGDALQLLTGPPSLPEFIDGYISIPHAIVKLSMVKKPWGWDRVTTIGPDYFLRESPEKQWWRSILPEKFRTLVDSGSRDFHYPVFQIVDGDGNRIEANYAAYLEWANEQTPDDYTGPSTFEQQLNYGAGTQLVGRLG